MSYIPFLFPNYQAVCVFTENLKTGMETYSIALFFQMTLASAVSLNKFFLIICWVFLHSNYLKPQIPSSAAAGFQVQILDWLKSW